MPAGRPRKYVRKGLHKAFLAYIESTDIPIVAEFASKNGLYKQFFYDNAEFSTLVKKCTSKKEAALERLGLTNGVNCSMAIFSLKQLGWTDKQDTTLKGDVQHPIVMSNADGRL